MLPTLLLSAVLALSAFVATANASTATVLPLSNGNAAGPLPTPQFRRYQTADGLPGSTVYSVVQDKQGLMWFGVGVDLVRYDGVDFQTFSHHSDDPASLPEGSVYSLFADHDNQLWVGGFGSGLNRHERESGGFQHWRHDPADPQSLASDNVWSITQTPDGDLWVATDAGLDRMLPDGWHFEHVRNPLGKNPDEGFGAVRALLAEPDGKLWIGSSLGVFVREVDGRVHQISLDSRLQALKVWRIQGGGDDVRIAVRGGLLRVGADGKAWLYAPGQIPSIDVYSSTVDQAGHLWITTRNGLYLDDGGPQIHLISGQPMLLGSLPAQQVWQSLCDIEGACGSSWGTAASPISHLAGTSSPGSLMCLTTPTACAATRRRRCWRVSMVGCGWVDMVLWTSSTLLPVRSSMRSPACRGTCWTWRRMCAGACGLPAREVSTGMPTASWSKWIWPRPRSRIRVD